MQSRRGVHTSRQLYIDLQLSFPYCMQLLRLLSAITLSVPNGCNFTTNFGSMMSQYFLMNFSLSARIYPIVDFEVVGTLIYNGLSGFALKRL